MGCRMNTWLGARAVAALSVYEGTSINPQRSWVSNCAAALAKIRPQATGVGMAAMTASSRIAGISGAKGDFGPVPQLTRADLLLAQHGYAENYLVGVNPVKFYQLVTIWLHGHLAMLNTAIKNGLTDDQLGMVKERGSAVGPRYLVLPAATRVELPGGTRGSGFLARNPLCARFPVFAVPLVPGLRDLAAKLKLYRSAYRYPTRGDDQANMAAHSHGWVAATELRVT